MKRSDWLLVWYSVIMTGMFFCLIEFVGSQVGYSKMMNEERQYYEYLRLGFTMKSEIDKERYIGVIDQWLKDKSKQEVLDFFTKDSLCYLHKIDLTDQMKNRILEWNSFGYEVKPEWREDNRDKPLYDWHIHIRSVCKCCDDVYVLNGMPYYFFFVNDTLKLRLDTNPSTYNKIYLDSYMRHKDFEYHMGDYINGE